MTSSSFRKSHEEYENARQNRYEERIVKRLLKHYALPDDAKWELLHEYERMIGEKRPMLFFFHKLYPDFPMYLEARHLDHVVSNHSVSNLFKRFSSLPLMNAYTEAENCCQGREGKPFGLVFPWPYSGDLVIHNRPVDATDEWEPGMHMVWVAEEEVPSPSGREGVQLVIEPFDALLKTIDRAAPAGRTPETE